MKKWGLVIFSPLLVYLLDISYGLLKIDFGDASGHSSYGWLYIFSVLWLVLLGYVVTIILNFRKVSRRYAELSKWSPLKLVHVLSLAYLVVSLATLIMGNFSSVMALAVIGTARGQLFLTALVINWIATLLILLSTGDDSPKHLSVHRATAIVLMSLALLVVPGISFVTSQLNHQQAANQYAKKLSVFYRKTGEHFKVTDAQLPYGIDGDTVAVNYVLNKDGYRIKATATFEKGKLTETSYADLNDSWQNLTYLQTKSALGKQIVAEYKKSVIKGVKASHTEAKLEKEDDQTETNPEVFYINSDTPNDQLASKQLKRKLSAGGKLNGWLGLNYRDLLKNNLVGIGISLEGTGHQNSTKALKHLISKIKWANLPDGTYLLSLDYKERAITVSKSGKSVDTHAEVPSRGSYLPTKPVDLDDQETVALNQLKNYK